MVAIHKIRSLERSSLIHYEIESIEYSKRRHKFKIILVSYFQGWPEIKVSVGYYSLRNTTMPVAYIGGTEYRLTSANAAYVEKMAQEVTDAIKDTLRRVNCEKDKKLKRISIFGPS